MVSVIADVLKSKLDSLDWIERFSGLVAEAKRADTRPGADNQTVVVGYQSYPVACDVNIEKCWEAGRFKMLEPDSTKAAIAFFVDNGGSSLTAIEGPKTAFMRISFDLKFLCWLNLTRLGETITNNECYASGRISPYVIAQLYGQHTAADVEAVFGAGSVEAETFQAIEVTGFQQLKRDPAIFQPFTFSQTNSLFLWPYDYFGLRLTGTFVVNRNCLPDLYTAPFVAETDECIDPTSTPLDARITEDGEPRITEASEITYRITE